MAAFLGQYPAPPHPPPPLTLRGRRSPFPSKRLRRRGEGADHSCCLRINRLYCLREAGRPCLPLSRGGGFSTNGRKDGRVVIIHYSFFSIHYLNQPDRMAAFLGQYPRPPHPLPPLTLRGGGPPSPRRGRSGTQLLIANQRAPLRKGQKAQ